MANKSEGKNGKRKILEFFLRIIFRIFEFITDSIFWFMNRKNEKTELPPITNLLLLESASSLALKIRTQKVTSEEVVQAFIDRINTVNPIINGVVDHRFDLALEEARQIDKQIQSGNKIVKSLELETPFLGVPFTIKDCFAVKGLRHTGGLLKRKDIIPDYDADVVSLMKKAGGIMLAVTNVSELCLWWESNNNVYGRSRNPYDTNRIVGGSSGGEGATLSSAASPLGIGSDIGGSIRMPAYFNGIFGHKPSTGIVSNFGQVPVAGEVLNTFLVTGPMSRFCADLIPMYRVLAAENVNKLKLDSKVELSKIRYFYMDSLGNYPLWSAVHPDVKAAQLKAVRHLQNAHGVSVEKLQLPRFFRSIEIWLIAMGSGGNPPFAEELALHKGKISPGKELFKWFFGRSEHTFAALLFCLMELFILPSSHPVSVKTLSNRDKLREELEDLLGDDGVLLVPPQPTAALYHSQPLCKPLNAAYTAIFNVLGFPVTQVPLGLGSWGVPLGVQVVGNLNNDHLTLAVAAELERAFGGWVCPSPIHC